MMKRRKVAMNRNGLTVTMVFLAESANYGEGIGNITSLKKMTRGDNKQYTYCLLYTSDAADE